MRNQRGGGIRATRLAVCVVLLTVVAVLRGELERQLLKRKAEAAGFAAATVEAQSRAAELNVKLARATAALIHTTSDASPP